MPAQKRSVSVCLEGKNSRRGLWSKIFLKIKKEKIGKS